jgi:hypothetical protein
MATPRVAGMVGQLKSLGLAVRSIQKAVGTGSVRSDKVELIKEVEAVEPARTYQVPAPDAPAQ